VLEWSVVTAHPPVDELTAADLSALPIFPLPSSALFPGAVLALHVFEPRYRDLVRDALAERRVLAVARLQPGFERDYEGRPPVFDVCGAGVIVEHVRRDDDHFDILLQGLTRVRILREHPKATSYRIVQATALADLPSDPALAVALQRQLGSVWTTLSPHLPEQLRNLSRVLEESASAGALSDRLAATLFADPEVTQRLLAELDPAERLSFITERLAELASRLTSVSPKTLN